MDKKEILKKEFRTNPNYLLRKVADEFLLVAVNNMELSQNKLMMLNETGRFIWENLQSYLTLEELVFKAKQEFEAESSVLEEQICNFIISLTKLGLIEERSN